MEQFMTERRHFPRYTCEFDCIILSAAGQNHAVQASDISEAGISLAISQSVMNSLASDGTSLEIGSKFRLALPNRESLDEEPALVLNCQVMHARRLSQEHYLIGAWFNTTTASEIQQISRLIHNARQSIEE